MHKWLKRMLILIGQCKTIANFQGEPLFQGDKMTVKLHVGQCLFIFQPTTPTKPVVFADWLAGVSPPDSNTINKHVHDMVEVSALRLLSSGVTPEEYESKLTHKEGKKGKVYNINLKKRKQAISCECCFVIGCHCYDDRN